MDLSKSVTTLLTVLMLQGCVKKENKVDSRPYELFKAVEDASLIVKDFSEDNPLSNYIPLDIYSREKFFADKMKEKINSDTIFEESEIPKIVALMYMDDYRKFSNIPLNNLRSINMNEIRKDKTLDSLIEKQGVSALFKDQKTKDLMGEIYKKNFNSAVKYIIDDYINEFNDNKMLIKKSFPDEPAKNYDNAIAGFMMKKYGELGFKMWKELDNKKAYKFTREHVHSIVSPGISWAVDSYFDFLDSYKMVLAVMGEKKPTAKLIIDKDRTSVVIR